MAGHSLAMKPFRTWRDVSIAKKLYFVVGIMAFLIVGELLTLRFAMHTLSAARAFVGGEGLWSKAQKNAAISIQRYGRTRDEGDFRSFLSYMEVPDGDRQARLELFKPAHDRSIVRAGFLRGRIQADDIDAMIDLLERFSWTRILSRAIAVWTDADNLLMKLEAAGLDYHAAIVADDHAVASAKLAEIKSLNDGLTTLEDEFSFVLGAGSRWLEHVVLTLLSIAVLAVESVGITLTLLTSRSISRGLNELNATAMDIGRGDLTRTATPRSGDEIGQLARSVNQMGQMLQRSYAELEVRVKERTSELARSRDQLDVILKGITDGITVIDVDGRFVFVNEAGARMSGASSVDEFLQTSQVRRLERLELRDEHGEPFPAEKLPWRLVFAGVPSPPEVMLRSRYRPGGEELWTIVKSAPIFDERGKTILVVTIFKDVTSLKRAEDAIRFLDEASQILASSMNTETTLARVAELSVPRFADLCTIDLLGADGSIESLVIVPAEPGPPAVGGGGDLWPGVMRVLRGGGAELHGELGDEWMATTPNGEGTPRRSALRKVHGAKSAVVVPLLARGQIFGAITLVSAHAHRRYAPPDLKTAEELARRSGIAIENATLYQLAQNAVRARDEFLSIASHELNTPLTSLRLQLYMAKRKIERFEGAAPVPGAFVKALDASDRQVARLTRLVADLLDVSRIQAGKVTFTFERLNLSDIVREVVNRFSEQLRAAGIQVQLGIQDGIIGSVDQMRLEQIVDNLLSNAIKYAPGAPLTVSLAAAADVATLVVDDRGPGIAADKQALVFERFERVVSSRSVSGLGLGLFIVKQIVDGYGGSIELASRVGEGTRFTVKLPIAERPRHDEALDDAGAAG